MVVYWAGGSPARGQFPYRCGGVSEALSRALHEEFGDLVPGAERL